MRLCKRNLSPIYYCLYQGKEPVRDADGYETGEWVISYSDPVKLVCSVSHENGFIENGTFGTLDPYSVTVITDKMDCPIDENTVVFIESEPIFKDGLPLYTHKVQRIAKSLNGISYVMKKVDIS